MHEALARQIGRQRTPCRPRTFEGLNRDHGCRRCRRLGLRLRLRDIGFMTREFKLKLIEDGAAFGGLSELLVAQLGNQKVELGDRQRLRPASSPLTPTTSCR